MIQVTVPKGAIQQSVVLRFGSAISFTIPSTSIGETTSGLEFSYTRIGGGGGTFLSPIAISYLPLSFQSSAWSGGGVEMLNNGFARLDVPDAAFAKAIGVNGVLISGSATGIFCMDPCFVTLADGANSPFASTPQSY